MKENEGRSPGPVLQCARCAAAAEHWRRPLDRKVPWRTSMGCPVWEPQEFRWHPPNTAQQMTLMRVR